MPVPAFAHPPPRDHFCPCHHFSQIWATIIQYYTGSIADGADRWNLRKLHFFNQQKQVKCIWFFKIFFSIISRHIKMCQNKSWISKKQSIQLHSYLFMLSLCWFSICFFRRMSNFDEVNILLEKFNGLFQPFDLWYFHFKFF